MWNLLRAKFREGVYPPVREKAASITPDGPGCRRGVHDRQVLYGR